MGRYVTRHTFNWKAVKGDIPKKSMVCPRCNNQVDYFLAWDGEGVGIGNLILATNKAYVYKCPICPNYEEISQQFAKALIKDSK